MKVRLHDVVDECRKHKMCDTCEFYHGECIAQFNGIVPSEFKAFVDLCQTCPDFARDILENKEVEI